MKQLGLMKLLCSNSKVVLRSTTGMQNITKKDISETNKQQEANKSAYTLKHITH